MPTLARPTPSVPRRPRRALPGLLTAVAVAAVVVAAVVVLPAPAAQAQAAPGRVPLSVTVWRVVELDDPDGGPFEDFGDYYATVGIGGVSSSSAVTGGGVPFGVGIIGSWTIEPFWSFSASVAANDTHVPVTIALADQDTWPTAPDDPMDISPVAGRTALELTVNARNGTWRGDTLTGDRAPTGAGDPGIPRAQVFFEIAVGSTSGDGDDDGDGLLDGWEALGFDGDGDGVVDVDLPRMGADPRHKDLFVELDTMTGLAISRAGIAAVKTAFAGAPMAAGGNATALANGVAAPVNPDGSSGINLWVDTGKVIDPRVDESGVAHVGQCRDGLDNDGDGAFDTFAADRDMNGTVEPADPQCPTGLPLADIADETGAVPTALCADGIDNDGDGTTDAADPQCLAGDDLGGGGNVAASATAGVDPAFYAVKAANFSPMRRMLFRYALSAHDGLEDGATTPDSCTDGLDNGGDGTADDADTDCGRTPGGMAEIGGNDLVEYNHDGGTFMHELGHTLNLHHGGDDDHNCKSPYVSVMNYDHQFGIRRTNGTGILDFAPPRLAAGGRGSVPAELDEHALDESQVLDAGDSSNRTIFTDATGMLQAVTMSSSPDWDGDGAVTAATVSADIDAPSVGRGWCPAGTGLGRLHGWDDWSTISLPFRQFGDSGSGALNPVVEPRITVADRVAADVVLGRTDVGLVLAADPAPAGAGGTTTVSATLTNHGPQPADGVEVSVQLPAGASLDPSSDPACQPGAPGTAVCRPASLAPGASTTVVLVLHLDPTILGGGVGPVQVRTSAVAAFTGYGSDSAPADNTATADTTVVAISDSAVAGVDGIDVPATLLVGTTVVASVATTITNGPTPADVEITQTPFASPGLTMGPLAPVSQVEPAVAAGEQRQLRVSYTLECTRPGPVVIWVEGDAAMRSAGHLEPDPRNDVRFGTFVIDCVLPVAINVVPGDATNRVVPGKPFDVAVLTTKAGEYGLPLDVDPATIDLSSVVLGPSTPPGTGFRGVTPSGLRLDDSIEVDEVTRDGDLDGVATFTLPGLDARTRQVCVQGRVWTKAEVPVWFYGCDTISTDGGRRPVKGATA